MTPGLDLLSYGMTNISNAAARVRSGPMRQKFSALSPEELLGPLNDVERKFAPREIFLVLRNIRRGST